MSRKVNGHPYPFPAPDASFETGFKYPFRRPAADAPDDEQEAAKEEREQPTNQPER